MAEIVNLRLARKAKHRADAAQQAAANRALHGESRAARVLRKADANRAERLLDGARREDD